MVQHVYGRKHILSEDPQRSVQSLLYDGATFPCHGLRAVVDTHWKSEIAKCELKYRKPATRMRDWDVVMQ